MVRLLASAAAAGFRRYRSCAIACSTRCRMSGSTFVAPLTTRDTVCWDTPASRATSDIRGAFDLEASRSPRPLEFRASEGAGVVDTIPLSPATLDEPRNATAVGAPAVSRAPVPQDFGMLIVRPLRPLHHVLTGRVAAVHGGGQRRGSVEADNTPPDAVLVASVHRVT